MASPAAAAATATDASGGGGGEESWTDGWQFFVVGAVVVALLQQLAAMWMKRRLDAARSGGEAAARRRAERRDYRRSELPRFDGAADPTGPILIGVKGKVWDMGQRGEAFYGPGAPYGCFAGRDATLALARVDTDAALLPVDCRKVDVDTLDDDEREALDGWIEQFQTKYDLVGDLLDDDDGDDEAVGKRTAAAASSTPTSPPPEAASS